MEVERMQFLMNMDINFDMKRLFSTMFVVHQKHFWTPEYCFHFFTNVGCSHPSGYVLEDHL